MSHTVMKSRPRSEPRRDAPNIAPEAASYYRAGTPGGVGLVLIHGLTASPTEVRPVAAYLEARDPTMTLSCPLLPGHGTTPDDLRSTSPEAWRVTVADEVSRLAAGCGSVGVLGVSLGAVLAAQVALDDSRVASVSMLAPVFRLGRKAAMLIPVLRHFLPYVRKSRRSLENHRAKRLFSYDRYPFSSLAHVHTLGRQTRARLRQLTVPALLAIGRHDRYVSRAEAESLRRALGKNLVSFVECPRSGHVLPHEPDAAVLFEAIGGFLATQHGCPTRG